MSLPKEVIDRTYKYYWKFFREKIKELPLKQELTEEEFSKLRTSFNISSIGKFYCTYDNYLGNRRALKYKREHEETKKD